MPREALKINTSITDFAPLFLDLEYLFKGLQSTGVDGVELVLGVKSRWSIGKLKHLSQKYHLPIASLHQPVWSGLGLYFDEGFFDIATELGVTTITCHPLPHLSLHDKKMQEYLKKLSRISKERGLTICLENLASTYSNGIIDTLFPLHHDTTSISDVASVVAEHGLKMTLDIDHLRKPKPYTESWFKDVLPKLGNIHLSSFVGSQNHLPLYLGEFKSREFVDHLSKNNYKGLLTFEIYYPNLFNLFTYDFTAIKRSVAFLRAS